MILISMCKKLLLGELYFHLQLVYTSGSQLGSMFHISPLPSGIWQYLEILWVVIAGEGGGGALLAPMCRKARMHMANILQNTVPTTGLSGPKMSVELKLRTSG